MAVNVLLGVWVGVLLGVDEGRLQVTKTASSSIVSNRL
jgi:hypothetical protein